jgi:hypothetical protein
MRKQLYWLSEQEWRSRDELEPAFDAMVGNRARKKSGSLVVLTACLQEGGLES